MKNLVNYTNSRLKNWYETAKLEYNVIGSGHLKIENDRAIINYTENGEDKVWSMFFVPEYLNNGIDYIFNVWMDEC